MVNYDGQLYTIEGVAAGLIMLLTAFIVVGTTSVYTPGDTHISDMQLEQLGGDALHMMNTPNMSALSAESDLQYVVKNNNVDKFKETFLSFCNTTGEGPYDHIQFSTDIYYRNSLTNSVNRTHFTESRKPTGGEHAVRVTEWVHLTTWPSRPADAGNDRYRVVLLEVLVWRD